MKTRTCAKCGIEYPATPLYFHRSSQNKTDGLRARCRYCRSLVRKLEGRKHRLRDEDIIYNGDYKNGKRHGRGMLIYPDGAIHRGSFVDDKRHGEGVYTFADGKTEKGIWVNGFLKGIWLKDNLKFEDDFSLLEDQEGTL